MVFKGTVCRRSSASPPKNPKVAGESEIFRHNPQRVCRIKEETGWESVFCGTLNLRVCDGVFEGLCAIRKLFFEPPEDITHPTCQCIPKKRGGYHYYKATASAGGKTQEVLVRRADKPFNQKGVELVSSVKLMDCLQIDEGCKVEVKIIASSADR